jgi:hypothetical protein
MKPTISSSDRIEAFRILGCDLPSLLNPITDKPARVAAFNAAQADLLAGFKQLCFATHPDRFQSHVEIATERFKATTAAKLIVEKTDMSTTGDAARGNPTASARARRDGVSPDASTLWEELFRQARTTAPGFDPFNEKPPGSNESYVDQLKREVEARLRKEAEVEARRRESKYRQRTTTGPRPFFGDPPFTTGHGFRIDWESIDREDRARRAYGSNPYARPIEENEVFEHPPAGYGVIETDRGRMLVPPALGPIIVDSLRQAGVRIISIREPDMNDGQYSRSGRR